MASVIGIVIIAGLGSTVLVSEVRLSRSGVANQNQQDDIAQAGNLILHELSSSSLLDNTGTYPCGTGTTKLVLKGDNNAWTTYYATRAVTTGSTNWFGPHLLVRCGLPYTLAGDIDTDGTVAESVVLDRLASANGLTVTLNKSSTTLSREAQVVLTTQIGSGPSVSNTFQARSATNRVYSLYDLIFNDSSYCPAGTTVCAVTGSGTTAKQHFRPATGTSTITGSPTLEDIAYFPGKISNYTLKKSSSDTTACTRTACFVTGNSFNTTLNNINVLVFSDAEYRI
ncbi:hypothetical protein [Synechococcus sp. BA-132 BA5]|uniref:hypothetical protein n=1 Tax=Synechococcus sp. BA-132 BA5 TaxID=3110252 RepID=UPI002B1F5427|nr:hypothetical protein [Synechococcus sp. BA-132 BA5]